MTTYFASGTANNSTDAGFRAWGQEFGNILAAVGLARASDTGQINWGTVTLPGQNETAGFEIWRFNDTRQATAPIFIRIEYGNVGGAMGVWITVGQSTDGSGNINSIAQTPRTYVGITSGATAGGQQPRYACFARGSFWISFHSHQIGFAVIRSADPTGNITSDGCVVYSRGGITDNTSNRVVAALLRFGSQAGLKGPTQAYAFLPYDMDNSSLGVDRQFIPHYGWFPRVQNLHAIFSYIEGDLALTTTTSVDMGFGPITFMALGNVWGFMLPQTNANNAVRLALIWE